MMCDDVDCYFRADFTKLDSQPKGLAVGQGGLVVVACFEGVRLELREISI